jgi:hypothetical protein
MGSMPATASDCLDISNSILLWAGRTERSVGVPYVDVAALADGGPY